MERWGDKRYYSLDYYVKQTFHEKLYKIALDGGMTCPNRDGTLGNTGCIFAAPEDPGTLPVIGTSPLKNKFQTEKALSSANTPALPILPISGIYEYLCPRLLLGTDFMEALQEPDVKVLSIATRPDCLSDDI